VAGLLLLLSTHPLFSVEGATGIVCVAPVPVPIKGLRGAGPESAACASDDYSVKIDSRRPVVWPVKESIKITDLDKSARHRVVVLCGGKPRQSFSFRFSEESPKLCLFFNDLYWSVQLWPVKESPWCKCK
jgi:hypothetical protein